MPHCIRCLQSACLAWPWVYQKQVSSKKSWFMSVGNLLKTWFCKLNTLKDMVFISSFCFISISNYSRFVCLIAFIACEVPVWLDLEYTKSRFK
jgi:hypothetical protein